MKGIQFIHCADLHIGTNTFKNDERKRDFIDSFRAVAEYALEHKVDFVIIAGDFFNKKQIDPDALEGAIEVLSILKDAKIDVIVIEGNHDTSIYSEENSWLYFLSRKDYVKLLQTKFDKGEPVISKWDKVSKVGSYTDYGDIRIFGVGYLGASTKKKIELLEPHLKLSNFNIMMLHASINSMLYSDLGGIKKEEIEILKNKINYLALGHIHKKYELDNWILNPGSLENWRIDEATHQKGFFHVKLESNKIKEVVFIESKTRPVYKWDVNISNCKDTNDVYKAVIDFIDKNKPSKEPTERPIVSLTYVGKVDFSTLQIDNEFIKKEVEEKLNPLVCEIKDGANVLTSTGKVVVLPNKHKIEEEEIGKLIDLHPEYKKKKDLMTKLVLSFKQKVLAGTNEEELVGLVKGNITDLK